MLGLRYDFIVGLIKILFKCLCCNFVFVLNFVEVCFVDISEMDKNNCLVLLFEVVIDKLCKMIGVIIESEEWNLD